MKTIFALLIASSLMAQQPAVRSPTIFRPAQLPPVAQSAPLIQEVPQLGTAPNTWTLTKPITGILLVWWHGGLQYVNRSFVFSGDGNGGTLLTLTPAAIAAGFWSDNDELIAVYQ